MPKEILVINPQKRPSKKRRKSNKKGAFKMAKKRRTTKPRKNPSRSRKITRAFSGLNFKSALSRIPQFQLGMFAAKWAAKRFGEGATEIDPETWDWSAYFKGSLGAVGAAMLANTFKPGAGQTVLEGGLNLMIYKAVQNELIAGSDWASTQLGADDDDEYMPDEYLLTGEDEEGPYFFGDDGEVYPADERHRLPETGIGNLEPVGPLGGVLTPPDELGADPFETWAFRN